MPKTRFEKARQTTRQQRQAYHLTCSNCRTRKMRCDGNQPMCGICQVYNDKCIYDKPPPMSQILAMAEKVAILERTIEDLRTSGSAHHAVLQPKYKTSPPSVLNASQDIKKSSQADASISQEVYFPSTSAIKDPRQSGTATERTQYPDSWQDHSLGTCQVPAQIQYWEEAAMQSAAVHLHLPPDKVAHLLQIHWIYIHPTFLFVPRQVFLRDCAIGGPLFSPALLCVICLHSTRFTDRNLSDELLARARLLLSKDMHQEPTIPTLQALILLSAREIGKGSVSLAWLYSGMGFRMAIDLGIFTKANNTSDSQIGCIRERLAWSCFLWDKAISLYLGRVPTLVEPPDFELGIPTDCSMEHDPWVPLGVGDASAIDGYRPTPSRIYSCFNNFCKLMVIVNDILLNLYNQKRSDNYSTVLAHIKSARHALDEWRKATPDHLKLDATDIRCPPPHILMQNLVYHTTVILVHRPFRDYEPCQKACREASADVENLLLLLERTDSFSHVTYMMAYCAYTAATVAVEDLKQGIPGSQERVDTYMRALHGCRSSCPGIQRSIDIALRSLDSYDLPRTAAPETSRLPLEAVQPVAEIIDLSMPAFPYPYMDASLLEASPTLDFNITQYASLDGFPQQWSSLTFDDFGDLLI
ncbi:hypothetical protein EJ05DRAFT_441135 [Pseudovirgaria hyperparasitica]|uniref:Zn(2)-C6 fungal-type domain-containing protein n=1 Tax=Pseudovirgaria hyperparasitica TaxID=470096 RepID=A0A6A6W380_9PEZI|nr:uncharacterized protein EJ05DRAFT_441135 [Pseudovirgaria hyperparasitica]KAF2756436.1 hypothetical protein EJ05DRAFT_441135 [Pseudovirgaria hyperparasitica]